MLIPHLPAFLFLAAAAAASALAKKLTTLAALTGFLVGCAVYAGDGYRGLVLLALFFVLGTASTSWRKKDKLEIRGSATHQSTRNAAQVLANGGVAALAGLLAFLLPHCKQLLTLSLAASLASATADTLSAELGMVYGRRFFNILTGRRDIRGLDGVISIEGLILGTAGSAVIAAAYGRHWLIVIAAGLAGNLADSVLGAVFERRGLLGNDIVNFANTLIAAVFAATCTGFHC
jgi:uncharacterized protein (TIGR00297 family)